MSATSINLSALMLGSLLSITIIWRLHIISVAKQQWVYPLLLASFSVFYWAFALFSADYIALQKELFVGAFFIALAVVAFKIKFAAALYLLAAGMIFHALYAFQHDHYFINAGTPAWWAKLCGSFDLFIGLYFLYRAITFKWEQV